LNDTSYGGVDFLHKLETKPWLALLIILHSLIEFSFGLGMKVEFHR
jgi:hypothetical protein